MRDAAGVAFEEPVQRFAAPVEPVGLVEDHQGRLALGADLLEHGVHRLDLFLGLGMADIHDVEQQVRLHDFFEGGFEGFDQAVGQFADETHGVGQQHVLVGRQAQAPGGRIERGEQFILGQDLGAGEAVEQGGFAGVGVADDGGERPAVALARLALGPALAAHQDQFLADPRDAVLDAAAVGFQLRFTFAAPHADAALLAGQVAPEPGQPRQQMLELRQFDLQLALARAGAPGENVEDERGAVQHLAVENLLQVSALGRGKFIVEDDRIDVVPPAVRGKLVGLALADERGRVRGLQLLDAVADHLAARGGGQLGKFVQ